MHRLVEKFRGGEAIGWPPGRGETKIPSLFKRAAQSQSPRRRGWRGVGICSRGKDTWKRANKCRYCTGFNGNGAVEWMIALITKYCINKTCVGLGPFTLDRVLRDLFMLKLHEMCNPRRLDTTYNYLQ